jgi:deaminated glutathione amidase
MMGFAVAGIQMRIALGQDNTEAMAQRIEAVARRYPWVRMVLVSELAAFGPAPKLAQSLPGLFEERFQELARRHSLWIVPGSIYERSGTAIYNTAPVIDPEGRVVARYRKMFPFRPYEAGIEAGREFVVFDVPGAGRFGLVICYDIWFPETTRTLVAMGAEVILRPTLTDTLDREIELVISRAMAATNQAYVLDINGLGDGGYGRSLVVDPTGLVIHQAGVGEEIMPVELDFAKVRRERANGILGLGQPLKSFRDRPVDFPVYDRARFDASFLDSLGPLALPRRSPSVVAETVEPRPTPGRRREG